MSDTPRTDAVSQTCMDGASEWCGEWCSADFARDLERELNAANAELARLRAGGCARDQRTTQFCTQAVELQARLDNEREYSRRLEDAGSLALGYACKSDMESADEVWNKAKDTKP